MDIVELRQICLNCSKCELAKTRKNVVFGEGNTSAKIMFVGEAPGANEDESAKPFVGRGGKLLDEFFEKTDIDRQKDIYITNIVKCRPPENRDPKPAEWKHCTAYLKQQIELIKPLIIVCVGRIAAQRLIDKNYKIMQQHGDFLMIDGIYYTAILHPAAILRNINNKPLMQKDFEILKEKMQELEIF